MAEHAKFTFDLDFTKTKDTSRLMEQSDIDLLIKQAREQGYTEGLADGQMSVESRTSQQLAAAAEQIAGLGNRFLATLDQAQASHLATSARLAGAVGEKLAAHLISKSPTDEIHMLVKDCLSALERATHLVIRCNDALSDRIRLETEQLASQNGFEGRLVIIGTPDLAPGDCRIEWSDGGLVRDFAMISAEIDKKIEQFASHLLPGEKPANPIENSAETPVHDAHSASEVQEDAR